jgi:hypothetical protein
MTEENEYLSRKRRRHAGQLWRPRGSRKYSLIVNRNPCLQLGHFITRKVV